MSLYPLSHGMGCSACVYLVSVVGCMFAWHLLSNGCSFCLAFCGNCCCLAVMFVTAVIASRGGKGKSYCCIWTSLIQVSEVAVEWWQCDAGNVSYSRICSLCLLAPMLDLLDQGCRGDHAAEITQQGEARACKCRRRTSLDQTSGMFTLHIPLCFNKS